MNKYEKLQNFIQNYKIDLIFYRIGLSFPKKNQKSHANLQNDNIFFLQKLPPFSPKNKQSKKKIWSDIISRLNYSMLK